MSYRRNVLFSQDTLHTPPFVVLVLIIQIVDSWVQSQRPQKICQRLGRDQILESLLMVAFFVVFDIMKHSCMMPRQRIPHGCKRSTRAERACPGHDNTSHLLTRLDEGGLVPA